MPNDVFTPGPLYLFAEQIGGAITYLGTCVTAPDQEGEKFKIPIMNDLGGRSVPFQLVKDGEVWMVNLTMNRFNMGLILELLALDSDYDGDVPILAGQETNIARGTLVIGLSDWGLTIINGYAGTPAAGTTPANLLGGRRFMSANIRKYKESTEGTRVLEVAMSIECQNVFNQETFGFANYEILLPTQIATYMQLVE